MIFSRPAGHDTATSRGESEPPFPHRPVPESPVVPASARTLELRQQVASLDSQREAMVGAYAKAEAAGAVAQAAFARDQLSAVLQELHDVRRALEDSEALDREIDQGRAEAAAAAAEEARQQAIRAKLPAAARGMAAMRRRQAALDAAARAMEQARQMGAPADGELFQLRSELASVGVHLPEASPAFLLPDDPLFTSVGSYVVTEPTAWHDARRYQAEIEYWECLAEGKEWRPSKEVKRLLEDDIKRREQAQRQARGVALGPSTTSSAWSGGGSGGAAVLR